MNWWKQEVSILKNLNYNNFRTFRKQSELAVVTNSELKYQ